MKISARNVPKGRVKSILPGSINAEVTIELPGGIEIVSVITKASVEALGLKIGGFAYAVIKANNVMVGVE